MFKFETAKTMQSNKKISQFLIAATLLVAATAGCSYFHAKTETPNANANAKISKDYKEPKRIATIKDDAINESSGLVASRKNAGAFWTHNDSGDDAFLYAFDKTGKKLGVWRIADAKNIDWEDLAAYTDAATGENYLFAGDIGNNERKRKDITIYKIVEPRISPDDADSSKKSPRLIQNVEKIRLEYPNAPTDAETLLVNPANADIYIVGKSMVGAADIYKASPPFDPSGKNQLKLVGQVAVPSITQGFLTGGAISPDGKRLILCDYVGAYEFVLPAAKNFDEIFKAEPEKVELGERAQGEAVTYSPDGKTIYATSEKRPAPLIEVQRK